MRVAFVKKHALESLNRRLSPYWLKVRETGIKQYVIRRLLMLVPFFLASSILVYSLLFVAGNPIHLMLLENPWATNLTVERLTEYYGLDKPLIVQWGTWVLNFMRLEFGTSIWYNRPVTSMLVEVLPETIKLQVTSIVLAVVLAIFAGVNAAKRPNSAVDALVTAVSSIGSSMPYFWIGLIMILVFSYHLGWLPSFGAHSIGAGNPLLDSIVHMIMPAALLSFYYASILAPVVRAGMLQALRDDYVLAAKACGLSDRKVTYKYALRVCLGSVVSFLGMWFGIMLGGSPIIETVFSWPGVGYLFVNSLRRLDYPVVLGVVGLTIVFVILSSLVADLVCAYLDPSIRFE